MSHEDELAKVWMFSKLERSDLTRIGKLVVARTFKAGEEIVKEGEQAVAFYVITKGRVEVRKGETRIATFGAGDAFGEMALLDGFPRVASVYAVEDTGCLVMTRWDFTAELRAEPSIALAMLPVMSRRIRELEDRLEEMEARG
jgi:CRP-like cAMP-binding protein